MDRSSSRRALRSERISNSPYKRPAQSGQSTSPFSTLKSIYSYVTAPFSKSQSSILPMINPGSQSETLDIDQGSQSGSEDNWEGSPPEAMNGQDVFSLAQAGGRDGEAFVDRANSWRSQNGRNLQPFHSLEAQPRTPMMPGLSLGLRPSASMSAFSNMASSSKRPLSPPSHGPNHPQAPAPSFLPPVLQTTSSTASSAALTAFLDAKRGQQMTPEDFRVMETLMDSMKAESSAGTPPRKAKEQERLGGWSAGKATPRTVKRLPETSTPSRPTTPAFATPNSTFALGRVDDAPASPSSRRITYLGPGMSPRRMLPKSRGSTTSLFSLANEPAPEESEPKRRKVEPALPKTIETIKSSTAPAVSSPLSSSSQRDNVKEGKRRAADIMKELIEEEIGPLDQPSEPDFMIINPYDTASRSTSTEARSLTRSATPHKSILRSSLRASSSTPLRGAAAKLEAHKSGRKLTTLEILEGTRPWSASTPSKLGASQQDDDEVEVDELFDEEEDHSTQTPRSPSPEPVSEPHRPSLQIPQPDRLPKFNVPQIDTPSRPIPTFKPSSSSSFDSPSRDAAISAALKKDAAPTFTPSRYERSASPPDFAEVEDVVSVAPKQGKTVSADGLYLSARDTAARMAKAALPFFTFTLPTITNDNKHDEAKRLAASRPAITFTFTLAPAPAAPPATVQGPWTCDLCMLSNPATATEKCTICEAPKPKPKEKIAGKPTSSQPASQWQCDLCMLTNPDSAKEKCQICEAPRPASSKPPGSGNGFGSFGVQKSAGGGDWECSLCMLKNPDSAKEKCQICEAPRK